MSHKPTDDEPGFAGRGSAAGWQRDVVDTLARKLPAVAPSPERSRAMRNALLDAATPAPRVHWWRRWLVGLALAGAVPALAALLLWLRTGEPARPPSGASPTATPAPDAWPTALADGMTVFEAPHVLRWTAHDTELTAPAGARFVVAAQDHRVQSIAVMHGWVVIAAARQPVRMVGEGEVWQLEPSAPAKPGTRPDARTPAAIAPPKPADRAAPPAITAAPRAPAAGVSRPRSAESPPAPVHPSLAAHAAAERAYRDGLRTLLAGDARAAIAALDQACAATDVAIEDSCYWAAVAAQRLGERSRARRGYDDFLRRWPASTHAGEAHVALGWLLLDAAEPGAARAHFAAAAADPLPTVRSAAQRGLDTTPAELPPARAP